MSFGGLWPPDCLPAGVDNSEGCSACRQEPETMEKHWRRLVFIAAFILADAAICWVVLRRPF